MLYFFEKQNEWYDCEVTSFLLTYRVKTCVSAHTDSDDYKGYGGLFLFETFELSPMGISCQLSVSFWIGFVLPQILRVLVWFIWVVSFDNGEGQGSE